MGVLTPIHLPKLLLNGQVKHSKKSVALHAGDKLRTRGGGKVDVCLVEKDVDCKTKSATRMRVMPSDNVLLRILVGKASCYTGPGSNRGIAAGPPPGSTVTPADDPVFSVSVANGQTVVKVLVGAVAVTKGQSTPVVVGAGMQTQVPKAASAPLQPTTISLAPAEKTTLQTLAAQVPKPGLAKPDPDDSKALQAITARKALGADFDKATFADRRIAAFSANLLSSLAKAWGVSLRTSVTSPSVAATDLAKGTADVFVTADPAAVTAAGRQLKLGDAAGVAAVPFASSGKTLIQLATRADAGLAIALRRYLAAATLQSKVYANAYAAAFGGRLPYAKIGDLAFPTVGHTSGFKTDLNQGFAAVVNGQLAPGLKVSTTVRGVCSGASTASWRADAWVCSDTNGRQWDPCFAGIANTMVCPTDPPATLTPVNVAKFGLIKPLPRILRPKRDPVAGPARRIVTATRTVCQPSFGATSSFGSQPITYQCLKAPKVTAFVLAGQAYRAGTPWTILTVPADWQTTPSVADTVGIAAIWFW